MIDVHSCLEDDLTHIIFCLILVQPRKTGPYMTERNVDWDVKHQIN